MSAVCTTDLDPGHGAGCATLDYNPNIPLGTTVYSLYIFRPPACARIAITYTHLQSRFYGVMVSTLDSDSNDPGSNPGRTCTLFVCFEFLVLVKKNKTNKTVGWRVHHKQKVRRPGIEPGSKRWQRSIITTRPSAPSANSEPLVVPAASDHNFVCFL